MSEAAPEQRIARLTRRQKDCLQLVAQGYTSKQIGRQLGISYSTVDNHIQAAVQLLEMDSRAEAGRLLARFAETGQGLPSQSPAIASSHPVFDQGRASQPGGWRRLALLLPPIGGLDNALSPSQSLLAISRIAFFSALAFIACVMIVKMSFRALT